MTVSDRDVRQQQCERDCRCNVATALHEFEPALGNFPGADQSVSLHFYPQPCNGDAFIEACRMQCRNRLTIHLGIARQKCPFGRSEEHTSELQSLMRISYAVFCLKKKKITTETHANLLYRHMLKCKTVIGSNHYIQRAI